MYPKLILYYLLYIQILLLCITEIYHSIDLVSYQLWYVHVQLFTPFIWYRISYDMYMYSYSPHFN